MAIVCASTSGVFLSWVGLVTQEPYCAEPPAVSSWKISPEPFPSV